MFSKEVMAMVTYSDLFQYVHIITKLLVLVKGGELLFCCGSCRFMLYSFWVLSRVCPELTVCPPCGGNNFESPRRFSEGVMAMVTYSDLFQYSLVIIGIVALIIQIFKKK